MEFIIRWKSPKQWKHRSNVEEELRRSGWGPTMTDEQLDKMKYAEKKSEMNHSAVKNHVIDKIPDGKE